MSEVYNGDSKGFDLMCDGYIDYAMEVISHRSVPDIRDGLKPVGRRCIYGASRLGTKDFSKCLTHVGEISKLHPHGDGSIYNSLCGMTDKNGTMGVPLFDGHGEFGKVSSTGTPAAPRYTKAKLGKYANLYLRDMDACKMIPAEEGDGFEPEVLPVRFPAVLVNGTSGMAVSVATMIPSFNFGDVLDITEEYIKTGDIKTVITPDFPTGGVLVSDQAELRKIMHTGKGRLKIRAKVEIEGKVILVKEVPFGKTVESILRGVEALNLQGIQSIQDSTGFTTDNLVKITCKTSKVVEQVLLQLYKHRILQTSFASNMLFIEGKEPIYTGVIGAVGKWLEWRRSVVKIKFDKMIDGINAELVNLDFFVRLVQDTEKRDKYVDIVVAKGKSTGGDYLKSIFDDISDDVCEWIADRNISAFNNGGRYLTRHDALLESRKEYEYILDNIDEYILKDINELRSECKDLLVRKTEETSFDYKFSKLSEAEKEDDSFCVYTVYKDGFITKTRTGEAETDREVLAEISAQANSVLVGFDCYGRVIRVYGTDIPFTSKKDTGVYLHKYFGVGEFDEYRIVYMGLLDGKKRMLVYQDGYVGFLDTSEWVGKKHLKVTPNGVDPNVGVSLLEVFEEDDIPEYLVMADDTHTRGVKLGILKVSDIRVVGRRTRAKVFAGKDINIKYITGVSYIDLIKSIKGVENFLGKLRYLGDVKVAGALSEIGEGRYIVS